MDSKPESMAGVEPKQASALRYVLSWNVAKRSLIIALVVGCLLSVANQWDVLLRGPFDARLGTKIFLNFLIPFAVSSVSAVVNRQGR